ncbi:MAG: carbohydrate deacetylase [Gaiellaceae bacterium]
MSQDRRLIVTADDFGRSLGVNRGIIETHERGIVTSTSLMVFRPGAYEAATYARAQPGLSTGLHIELPWKPRRWSPQREPAEAEWSQIVSRSVLEQMSEFRTLVGREPTHLDSHRHAHRHEPLRSIALKLASTLGVPLRELDPRIQFCGDFYGQSYGGIRRMRPNPRAISREGLSEILAVIGPGVTELCCHPGYAYDLDSNRRQEPYRGERTQEIQTLCDPQVRREIERLGLILCRFEDLPPIEMAAPPVFERHTDLP